MLVLSGATLVCPDRLLSPGMLVVDGDRIADIRADTAHGTDPSGLPLHGHLIVPAFIDVHTHGVAGVDTLDGDGAVSRIARRLPRHGVAAFCPTTVACEPEVLRAFLDEVRQARATRDPVAARVLPAHLESNFINPAYAGAQPVACLRTPRAALERLRLEPTVVRLPTAAAPFDGDAILREIAAAAADVGIVTLAPEIEGGLELVQWLVAGGHRVSLGHSAASHEVAQAAVALGARQVTHLFNRMPPLHHREPGLAGAALQLPELVAEIIADGVHVHPAMLRLAVAAKGAARVMAITDGTAAAGMPTGSRLRLGSQTIVAGADAARLDDGTLAGSTATMDAVFRRLVEDVGLTPIEAATVCATTPARELGLTGHGVLTPGAMADLVVLGPDLSVVQTYIGGRLAWPLADGRGDTRGDSRSGAR